ncbi:unnamed protein product [Adineta steineri]|uniref:Sec16 Sec23-binding domain-containing protein n=1 Tax=Adineta steineri TaxID=433720 RepID=A0A813N2W2_9BILA|nr:unnamed protein product [Adineta steineri]
MNQSTTEHPQSLPPPMSHYIPPSVPPSSTVNPQQHQQQQYQQPFLPPMPTVNPQQQQQQHLQQQYHQPQQQQQQQQQQQHPHQQQPPFLPPNPEQSSHVQHPSVAAANSSETDLSAANFNTQQQQMAAMMQMQQQWAAGGAYAAPYMMGYPPNMMMMQPQPGMDRPGSHQSSRPPSRQSVTGPVSSSRSMVNGQTGGQTQAALPQGMLPQQGYPGYMPPGMYNPWFDAYWQSMYANYQNPYSFGYNDEMMKYWKQMSQGEDDRYSHHSAAYSHSKQSQHSSSMHTWGSIDSLNDPFYQNHNALANGNYPPRQQQQQPNLNQSKRPTKPNTDPNTLLTTASIPNQQIPTTESKTKTVKAQENADEEEEEEDDDDDDDEDDDEDDDDDEEDSDDGSSDRFSIKSDLAQVNDESSKARRTPLLYIRPHLRAKFVFDQLIQVLPQSPSDTNQPATVEILSANSLHTMAPSLVEERQLMSDFIGPLTASTAKSNVIRYCERQSQLANKAIHIIDRDALAILWQYMALLVKTNGVIDVRVDIPKILWSSSNTPVIEETSSNSNNTSLSPTASENSLREFLALGEIDTSIKFACENQLYTHALIISYLTDKQLFEKTIHNIISNLDNGDVLKTFYELGAGSIPSVISNVTKAHYGDWKRHLAVILANRTDANAQFVDLCVKTMGDTLITSGRIYAGHFCYLIANVPFGSYRNNADKIAVIGSIHAGQSNLSFATIPNLQLTEVYEYAVRRTLTTFTPLKIYYTSKLVLHGLKREALAYCEEIGLTLIRQGNTSFIQLVDLQLFILIAEKSRAFSRNFQLDPTSYKEPTWLIELRRIIQNLLDNTFLNKTMRDDLLNSSAQVNREQHNVQQQQQPINPPTYTDKQTSNINRQPEQIPTTAPVSYQPPITNTNTNIPNGYDPSNQVPTEQLPYQHPTANNYQNTLQVDTNVHYSTQPQSNYYPQQYYPSEPQQPEINNYSQQRQPQQQQPTQSDHLNLPSQVPPTNQQFYQSPVEHTQYIQPGLTSTPNPHPSQQPPQQQQWYPSGQVESRDRLPSNEQQQQQKMESMRRRSSIITFNDSNNMPPTNWQQMSTADNRKASSTSTHSNMSNKSTSNTVDTTNFGYQPPQLMSYTTNQPPSITEESPQQQPQTNGQTKKKHAIFDDSDDVFPNNAQKSSDSKANATAASQAAAATQKSGLFGTIMNRIGLKRPTQAHLPDDKNKTFKFDEKTGTWIDTSKPAGEQTSSQIAPPPMIPSKTPSTSFVTNPQQPTASSFNPSMPPGPPQPSSTLNSTIPSASSQPRTLSFAAGSTTTTTTANTMPPQAAPTAWQPQPNTNTVPQNVQPLNQSQPPQQQQKAPAQLSAAQQRLQAIRQQQQQQAATQQAPPATSSNQYSLKNRQTQSRYVDVLASTKGAVASNPNVSLDNLMPTPSSGMPTYTPSNQPNNYFVPGPIPSTTDSNEQSSS